MPINFPGNRNEVVARQKTDVQNTLQGSNPWLRNSWLLALIIGVAGRIYDFYYQLKNNLVPNLFPWTATSEYLQRWGGWVGLSKTPATQATGTINITGIVGSTAPAATEFQLSDGSAVVTAADGTIALVTKSVTLTRVGTVATAYAAAGHTFATGQSVTISGADQASYNGAYVIVVVDSTHFTYEVAGSPTTPATGTITASSNMAAVTATTATYGAIANQDSGAVLDLSTPITGIDGTAFVALAGLTGGTDEETDDAYRVRVQERYQNPVTLFNDAAIIAAAKSVAGVTRVWVQDCTPGIGQVTIYFARDNDASPIPDSGEVAAVKAAIMAIAPANVDTTYVVVAAPTATTQAFTFSSITPDTTTMRAAIEASLAQAFIESGNVGVNLSAYVYNTAIFGTVDLSTGAPLTAFTLTTPAADITVAAGSLPVLGTVSF